MLIYIDINHDVYDKKFLEFEERIKNLDLITKKNNIWTHYNESTNNTNIDVIIVSKKI